MKQYILLLSAMLAGFMATGQVLWVGDGDGTSWDDGANWSTGMVPLESDTVEINRDAIITGDFDASPRRLRVGGRSQVSFQLDMAIDNQSAGDHGLIIGSGCTVELGVDSIAHTFTFNTASNRNGLLINNSADSATVVVMSGATLSFGSHNNAVNITAASSQLINRGTITVGEQASTGMRIGGSVTNDGVISISSTATDGILVRGGSFANGPTGDITIEKCADDGVEITENGAFTNEGLLSVSVQDSASTNNNAIAVGTADLPGTFTNRGSAVVNADGGLSTDARAISVYEQGSLTNAATISATGGNTGSSIYNRNQLINDIDGYINLIDGRINANIGSLVNNGFIESARGGAGIFSTADATVVNNGFFRYLDASQFASGDGAVTDNGVRLNNIYRFKIDAAGTCIVDIAEVAYDWTIGGDFYARSGDDGSLSFASSSLSADSTVLRTTLPEVNIKVVNICSEAVITTNIDNSTLLSSVKVYPTLLQAGETIFIDLLEDNEVSLTVHDSQGRLMSNFLINASQRLATGDWLPGYYHLRFTTPTNAATVTVAVH